MIEKRKISPLNRHVIVTVPNRLHMFTYRSAFNVDGQTGGAGISINSGQLMEVRLSDKPYKGDNLVLDYFCNIFRKLFVYDGFFQVNYVNVFTVHTGLGTTISQTTALCWAINYLFGKPLTEVQLRQLIMDEYQEINGAVLIRGLETGVGVVCSLYGGINFVIRSQSYVHLEPSGNLAVLTFIPTEQHFQRKITLEEENVEKSLSFQADEASLAQRNCLIYQSFLPALLSENWDILGKKTAKLHTLGVKKMECSRFNYEYELKLINMMLKEGALLSGLSSLGPINYIVIPYHDIQKFKTFINKNNIASNIQIFEMCRYGIEVIA